MENRKKLIVLIIGFLGFATFLVVTYFGYDVLSSEYNKKNVSMQTEKDGDENNQSTKSSRFKTKVMSTDFTVYDENSNEVKLSDYRGTPVVLNFWASWCPPCREEMPAFNEMSNKYKDKVAILMINLTDGQRETVDDAKDFIEENDYDMKVLFDNEMDASDKYNITAIPRTIIIDKNGYIINDYSGGISKDILESQIKLLIK